MELIKDVCFSAYLFFAKEIHQFFAVFGIFGVLSFVCFIFGKRNDRLKIMGLEHVLRNKQEYCNSLDKSNSMLKDEISNLNEKLKIKDKEIADLGEKIKRKSPTNRDIIDNEFERLKINSQIFCKQEESFFDSLRKEMIGGSIVEINELKKMLDVERRENMALVNRLRYFVERSKEADKNIDFLKTSIANSLKETRTLQEQKRTLLVFAYEIAARFGICVNKDLSGNLPVDFPFLERILKAIEEKKSSIPVCDVGVHCHQATPFHYVPDCHQATPFHYIPDCHQAPAWDVTKVNIENAKRK